MTKHILWVTTLAAAIAAVGCAGQPGVAPDGREEARGPGPLQAGWTVEVRRVAGKAALELEVEADAPIPARAADPVLVVGSVTLREYRYVAADRLVFTTDSIDALPDRAEVQLGWSIGNRLQGQAVPIGELDKQRALAAPR